MEEWRSSVTLARNLTGLVLGFCFSVLHAKNVAPGIANFEKRHFPNGRGYQRLKNGCCFQDLHIT